MVKLVHYKDSLMLSEVVSCSGIELNFKGKFIGESKLSNDWYVSTGLNKIICVSFTGNQDVSELFTFQGSFTIIGIKIITQELEQISCEYDKFDIDYFGRSKEVFNTAGSFFSDYDSDHESIYTIDSTDIYKNNLFTKQDEFYFENGENYFGLYHQHSNGQSMTEAEHNSDSVEIFRKDQNNILYKPKPKRLRTVSIEDERTPLREDKKTYTGRGDQIIGKQGSGSSGGGGGGGSY